MRVRVDGVTFSYNSVKALDDVTVEVERGKVTCLLGPNGAGKTTLLKLIASYIKPERGAVYIDGKDLKMYSPRELARLISIADPHLPRTLPMRVVDFVLTARYPFQGAFQYFERDNDLKVVEEVSKETLISHLLDRRLDQLSSGELQRVIIAAALAKRPRILLLDEPSAFLDIRYRFDMLDAIKRYTLAQRTATIIALHDLYLASLYCDTVVLLSKGKVVSYGSPREVFTSQIIEEVYGVRVKVVPVDGEILLAFPLPSGEGTTIQEQTAS